MWAAWDRERRSPGVDNGGDRHRRHQHRNHHQHQQQQYRRNTAALLLLLILARLVAVFRCLAQASAALATGFHRFLARFSGRRRPSSPPPWTLLVVVAASTLLSIADACSSRTTPKPRPPAPTPRPNITFHTYECPPAYAAWYCLNGATCFTVKIGESLLYNCECTEGYMGPRCEYKDLDGSYMPSQRGFMLETASIAGGAAIAVLLVVVLGLAIYVNYRRRTKASGGNGHGSSRDCIDGCSELHRMRPTFGARWRTVSSDLQQHHQSSKRRKPEELQQVTTLYHLQQQQQQMSLEEGDDDVDKTASRNHHYNHHHSSNNNNNGSDDPDRGRSQSQRV